MTHLYNYNKCCGNYYGPYYGYPYSGYGYPYSNYNRDCCYSKNYYDSYYRSPGYPYGLGYQGYGYRSYYYP